MSLGIARAVLDDAIRRALPATTPALCELTGYSEPTIRRALGRLSRLGCVVRSAPYRGAADTWRAVDGAVWPADVPPDPLAAYRGCVRW